MVVAMAYIGHIELNLRRKILNVLRFNSGALIIDRRLEQFV